MELKRVFACGVSWGDGKPSVSEEYGTWRDLIDEEKANYYGVSLEDEIDIIEVNKWVELEEPIIYKKRDSGIINHEEIVKKCNEVFSRN